jgi:hypothetical protein
LRDKETKSIAEKLERFEKREEGKRVGGESKF